MSAHSLPVEFSRFAYENKLTLSVFVNMSFKISKHLLKCKIICLPAFPVPVLSGADCCEQSFCEYKADICRTMTEVHNFQNLRIHQVYITPGQRLSPSFARNMLSVIFILVTPPSPVIITATTSAGHGSHMRLDCNFHCCISNLLKY